MFQGKPQHLLANPGESLTGQYLNGSRRIDVPATRRTPGRGEVVVKGARANNLKNIDVAFPLGTLSRRHGRERLGQVDARQRDPLPIARADALSRDGRAGRATSRIEGHRAHRQGHPDRPVADRPHAAVEPGDLHRLFTFIRELFAMLPDARARGYKAGRFSFNVKGGRCETCQGDGVIAIEMHFLPDVYVTCEECKGRRYNRETLDIKYRGKSIAEMLELTVDQALPLVEHFPPIRVEAEDAPGCRPRLHRARAVGDDAVGRRGTAGEARARARARGTAARSTSSTSPPRPSLRGRP
jgi:excinuclease ABC subunit A